MPNIEFNLDHIARLAMLDIDDQERALFGQQLPSIVAYVSKLAEVDTQNIDVSAYISDQENVLREDKESRSSNALHDALINAFPESSSDALEVPAIFE